MSDIKNDKVWIMKGDCLERMKEIPDGSVDAVIVDPPYIGMINKSWDRLTEEDANKFFKEVFIQGKRVLRYGGRFISFGSNDTLKFLYKNNTLLHRELLVISKDVKAVSAGRNTKAYKQHVNCSEYVFVSTKYAREYVRGILLARKGSMTSKEINEKLGFKSNGGGMWSIYTGSNVSNQVPNKHAWDKFKEVFTDLPDYFEFEEVFNNDLSKGNILGNFNFRFKGRVHPTQKPVALMEYLIKTYTNEGETVLDFTAGSFTTGVACVNLNRKFIGIERDDNYFQIGTERVLETLKSKEA